LAERMGVRHGSGGTFMGMGGKYVRGMCDFTS